eukprot:3555531-Alexandrium_andersonii.AAC.1
MVDLPAERLPDITAEGLQRAFACNKANAGGPDGWAPADLQAMPRIAAHRLAQMLNAIECSEMQWPRAVRAALAAHVVKTG